MSDQSLTSTEPSVASARDYFALLKPRIMQLVVFTAAAGLLAAPGALHPVMAGVALLAIALGSGAAGAINMWFDRDIDAIMTRTATRPIPSGRVPSQEALALGLILSAVSVVLMWMATNIVAALLLAGSIFYYAVIYTMWLKRSTPQNIVIGGGAGAFPPVIGWAAVTGSAPLDAWLLFAIIFFWTPPHFWALSLVANRDYARAGIPMLPVTHGAKATRRQVFGYALVLFAVSLAPAATGLGGWIYAVGAAVMGLAFIALALRVLTSRAGDEDADAGDRRRALGLFAFSIVYLFVLFGLVMIEQGLGLHWPVIAGA